MNVLIWLTEFFRISTKKKKKKRIFKIVSNCSVTTALLFPSFRGRHVNLDQQNSGSGFFCVSQRKEQQTKRDEAARGENTVRVRNRRNHQAVN